MASSVDDEATDFSNFELPSLSDLDLPDDLIGEDVSPPSLDDILNEKEEDVFVPEG